MNEAIIIIRTRLCIKAMVKSLKYTLILLLVLACSCTKKYKIIGEIDGCSNGQDTVIKVVVLPINKVVTKSDWFGNFEIDSLEEGSYTVECFINRPRYSPKTYEKISDSIFSFKIPVILKEDIRILSRGDYKFYLPLNTNDSTCPICKKKDMIMPIMYGLFIPNSFPNNQKKQSHKYHLGGCIVKADRWYCERERIEF